MLTKTKQKFEFHKLGWTLSDGTVISGWWALITTGEQLLAYLEQNSWDIWNLWQEIKEAKEGHCKTSKANAMQYLLKVKALKEGRSKIDFTDCITYLSDLTTSTIVTLFVTNRAVYVNSNGGCRDISMNCKVNEEILETCTNRDFVYPEISEDDVRITKWADGNHYYITVNGIRDTGTEKFNTIEAAEEAKEKYLRENRFKKG